MRMGENRWVRTQLPALSRVTFENRIRDSSPVPLDAAAVERLFLHYSELQRWNRLTSLVSLQPGEDVVGRHYGESLAALEWIDAGSVVVDVGSGGGFPGFVLAAARPDLQVVLVEAREKKWSFLVTCCEKASLSCRCLNVRVASTPVAGFPPRIDFLTTRAMSPTFLAPRWLRERLSSRGGVLLWVAQRSEYPVGFAVVAERALPGRHRRLVLLRPAAEIGGGT